MNLADYTVAMMRMHPENWTADIDEKREIVIRNNSGCPVQGVANGDGISVTWVWTLLHMYAFGEEA